MNDPANHANLGDPNAIRRLLSDPEAKKVLSMLQKKDAAQLQSAAQAAMQGNPNLLGKLLGELSADPETKRAIEHLNQSAR